MPVDDNTVQAADPAGPEARLYTEWHANGLKSMEGWLIDGRRHGTWRAWHNNGFQAWEGQYAHGRVEGLWTFWDNSGAMQRELEFAADQLRRTRTFYRGGMHELSYLDNRLDGPAVINSSDAHYSNGKLIDDPWEGRTVEACGYRLKHAPDPDQRIEAARGLTEHLPFTEDTVLDLLRGLRDSDPRVVRECITVLGMAGEDATAAVKALEELAESDDPQTAERARAALRQISPR